ncbi:MAG: helix-turn-helix domain-containing protein [Thermodesulfovibrionales bacterium]
MNRELHDAFTLATALAMQETGQSPQQLVSTNACVTILNSSGENTGQYLLSAPADPLIILPWLLSIARLDTDEQIAFLEDYYGLENLNTWWCYDDVLLGYVMTPGRVTVISNPVQFIDSLPLHSDPFKDGGGEGLLTVADVARMLSISPKTVYFWAETRQIPHYKLNGCLRFKQSEIEAWIDTWHRDPIQRYNSNTQTLTGTAREGGQ